MSKTKINLLPTQLAPKSSVVKLVKLIKRGVIVGFSLYVIAAVGSIASFLFLSNRLETQSLSEDTLKISIKALEETEQRLLLVQDRLGKAEVVLGKATTKEEVASLDSFVGELPEGIFFTKAKLFPDRYVVNISSQSSEDLATLFSDLSVKKNYKEAVLTSYSYSEEGGYSVVLELSI